MFYSLTLKLCFKFSFFKITFLLKNINSLKIYLLIGNNNYTKLKENSFNIIILKSLT